MDCGSVHALTRRICQDGKVNWFEWACTNMASKRCYWAILLGPVFFLSFNSFLSKNTLFSSHDLILQQEKMVLIKAEAKSCGVPIFGSVLTVPLTVYRRVYWPDSFSPQPLLSPTFISVLVLTKSLSHLSLFITCISHACPCELMSHPHEEVFNLILLRSHRKWNTKPRIQISWLMSPTSFHFHCVFLLC